MIRIVESFFVKSAIEPKDYPASAYPEFAFVGRSNVGKSSLINALTNRHLMAKISNTPGKTRTLNFYLCRWKDDVLEQNGFMQFTDLPGYGFAEVSQIEMEKWRQMIQRYIFQRPQLKSIIVLVDIRHSADPKDITMLELLNIRKLDYLVVATKADKIGKNKIAKHMQRLSKELGLGEKQFIAVSSETNYGVKEVLTWLESRLR